MLFQGRTTRSRKAADENPTNLMTSRMTRAKAAAAAASANGDVTRLPPRRRAALGDLSNVAKMTSAKTSKLISVKPSTVTNNTEPINSIKPHTRTSESVSMNARRQLHAKDHESKATNEQVSQASKSRPVMKTNSSTSVNNKHPSFNSASSDALEGPNENISGTLKRNADESRIVADPHSRPKVGRDDDFFVEGEVETRATKRPRTQAWDDLDSEDLDDPLMVAEYTNDIFDYLYELEKKYMPNPDYINDQKDLGWQQRGLLMDWLVEIHSKLHLLPETLYLAANIVDRFMTLRVVNLDKIQLVGVTALLLAAKYEEVFPPMLHHFAYLTGGNFDENDILSAEKFVLQVLDFDLSYPNPLNFLRRISKADNYDVQSRSFGKYLLEISVVEHTLIRYSPSMHAAASMLVARHIMGRPEWDANLVHYSGDYTEADLRPVATCIVKYLASPVEHEALFKKYAGKRFFRASLIARQWAKANCDTFLQDNKDRS